MAIISSLFVYALFAVWIIATLAAPAVALLVWCLRQREKLDENRRGVMCMRCGYDLRGSAATCPECGLNQTKQLPFRRRLARIWLGDAFGLPARLGRVCLALVFAIAPGTVPIVADAMQDGLIHVFEILPVGCGGVIFAALIVSSLITLHGIAVERIMTAGAYRYPLVLVLLTCAAVVFVDAAALERTAVGLALD